MCLFQYEISNLLDGFVYDPLRDELCQLFASIRQVPLRKVSVPQQLSIQLEGEKQQVLYEGCLHYRIT